MIVTKQHRRGSPQGSILVCVLVALSVATTLIAAVTHSALKYRRQVRTERQLRQVELLVEAGAQRAIGKLKRDGEFAGEDWRLESEALPGFGDAIVEIEVTPDDNPAFKIHVVATLAADSSRPIRRSGDFHYSLPNPPNEE